MILNSYNWGFTPFSHMPNWKKNMQKRKLMKIPLGTQVFVWLSVHMSFMANAACLLLTFAVRWVQRPGLHIIGTKLNWTIFKRLVVVVFFSEGVASDSPKTISWLQNFFILTHHPLGPQQANQTDTIWWGDVLGNYTVLAICSMCLYTQSVCTNVCVCM